ncbi:divalent-cation tolerance protein CutA [Thermocrispum sp.]|uniref:divalent-cation tolerance protein CutA n=1 Tax=Thermocrispum sp. TaxID=2060768 RepID=UPI00257D52FA|nr:divalent-cation tolerance protein CutA [Thermocrispum sp.]
MTVPDVEVGERLVRTLVEEGVVACGNIVPGLTSIYRWKGAVERDAEALVILKLMEDAVPRLLTRAPELHPYEVPEVLVLPVIAGHGPYLDWLAESTISVRDRD